MPENTTAQRLGEIMALRNLKQIDVINMAIPYCQMYKIKLGRNDLSQYLSGKVSPGQSKLFILAKALNVSEAWLMGYDVPMERESSSDTNDFNSPTVSEETVTFPVLGEIAAGYDNIAAENWDGDKIEVPASYLKGRNKDNFFVLRVKGDSMYPTYHNGDMVLILKQSALSYSGQIGAVIYDDECSTLKKIEYNQDEGWLRLVPINPNYPPIYIENERLEHCRILGVPRLLIRDIND